MTRQEPKPTDRCAVCGKDRKPQGHYKAEAAHDPYCSAKCCREWHGLAAV